MTAVLMVGLSLAACSNATTSAQPPPAPSIAVSTPDPLGPVYSFGYKPVAVSAACLSDLKVAASIVPTDVEQDPPPENAPLFASAIDCQSIDEWETAALQYPDAEANVTPDAQHIAFNLGPICAGLPGNTAASAPLCIEDKESGLNVGVW